MTWEGEIFVITCLNMPFLVSVLHLGVLNSYLDSRALMKLFLSIDGCCFYFVEISARTSYSDILLTSSCNSFQIIKKLFRYILEMIWKYFQGILFIKKTKCGTIFYQLHIRVREKNNITLYWHMNIYQMNKNKKL